MSQFPSIPPSKDRNATVEKMRELVQIWKGERGNKLDQVITRRDLLDAGIVSLGKGGGIGVGGAITSPTVTRVGILTNLVANGGFHAVFLNWDGASQQYYAYTEIHRSSDDNLANAVLVGTAIAGLFVDTTAQSGQGYYYWVRAVSTSGNPSDFNATAGTYAEAVLDPEYVIEQIEGLISESELAAELLAPIQTIPTINQTLADYDIRIPPVEAYMAELQLDIPNIKEDLANYLNIPPFNQDNDYAIGEIVLYGGFAWRALVAMTAPSPAPIEGANWTNIGTFTTYDGGISSQAIAIQDVVTEVSDMTSATGVITLLDSRVGSVEGTVSGHSQAIQTLNTFATTNGPLISAHAESITSLQSSINDLVVSEFDADYAYAIDDIFRSGSVFYRVIATQTPPNATPPNATYYEPDPDYVSLQDTVTANAGALGLLTTRVEANEGNLLAQSQDITVLDGEISTVLSKAFDPDKEYGIDAVFSHEGNYYKVIATQEPANATPPDATYYELLVDYQPIDQAVSANFAALGTLTGRVDVAENKITVQSSDVSLLEATVSTVKAAAFDENKVYSLNTIFSYGGNYYKVIATQETPNLTPPNSSYYQLQVDYKTVDDVAQASSTALGGLTSRVWQSEQDILSQGQQLTTLNNYIETGDSGYDTLYVWHFDEDLEGWSATNATVTQNTGIVSLTTSAQGSASRITITDLEIEGGIFYRVRAKVRRTVGTGWTMRLYFTTSGHGFSASYYKSAAEPTEYENGDWESIEWDMSTLNAGGTNWLDSDITGLRIEFSGTASDVFEVDWLSVGRPGPGGASRAIIRLNSDVEVVDGKITSTSNDLTLLESTVNTVVVPNFDVNKVYKLNENFKYNTDYYTVAQLQTPPNATPPNATYYNLLTDFLPLDAEIKATAGALSLLDERVEATEDGVTAHSSDITALEVTVSTVKAGQFSTTKDYKLDTIFEYTDMYYKVIKIQTTETNVTPPNAEFYLPQPDYNTLEDVLTGTAQAYEGLNSRVETAEGKVSAHSSKLTALGASLNDVIVFPFAADKEYEVDDIFSHDVGETRTYYKVTDVQETETNVTPPNASFYEVLPGFVPMQALVSDNAQAVVDMDGNLSASRVIKVDANGRVAGIGLYSDENSSELVFSANSAFFIDPGQSVTPFNPQTNYASMDALRATQFVFGYAQVEGQTRFAINVPAYIQNGTITTAQIANAFINQGQIQDLLVTSAEIEDGAITNAKIGNIIQSNSFQSGVTGWRIDKTGGAEFHDISIYGFNGELVFRSGRTHLVTVNDTTLETLNANSNFELTFQYVYGAFTRRVGSSFSYERNGYGFLTTPQEFFDNNIYMFNSDYLKVGADNIGYTISTEAVLPALNVINVSAKLYAGNGSRTYTLKVYEYDFDLPGGVKYFSENYTKADTIAPTRVITLSSANTSTHLTLTSLYTPTNGTKHFSIAVSWPSGSGVDYTHFYYIKAEAQVATVSSTYIRDAAITKAKIGEAAVDTLKIEENAVTVIQVAEFADGVQTNSAWASIGSFIVNHGHSSDALILIDVSGTLRPYQGGGLVLGSVRFDIGGVSYVSGEIDMNTVSVTEIIGNGTYTARVGGHVRVRNAVIVPSGNSLVEIFARGRDGGNSREGAYYNDFTATATAAKR